MVVDEQGVEVEGVQVWEGGEEDKEVCGVRILVCSEVPAFFGFQIYFPGYIPIYTPRYIPIYFQRYIFQDIFSAIFQYIFSKEHRGRWMVTTQLKDGRQLALVLETEDDVGNQ